MRFWWLSGVRGSNLNARDAIDITATNANILASRDASASSDSRKHARVDLSLGFYGGSAGNSVNFSLDNLTGGVGVDSSRRSSDGITHANSRLVGRNIHIGTDKRTTIAGANISASGALDIKAGHLDVASVRDSRNSRSHSQGLSVSGSKSDGVTGAGANMGMSHSREKHTVLTTLTGGKVHIDVAKDTRLKGAMIAAVDARGNDNGNLTLKTGTLEVSSLSNTRNSSSVSLDVNAGISSQQQRDRGNNKSTLSTVGIDFANNRANSKTKTLGTIGKGSIEVASVDKSSTKMLNRDIRNNTVDIYDIESHKGLKGSLDTRLLTKEGRARIRKDFREFGRNMQIVAKGLPEANNGNAIIAMIGKGLDKISEVTGGIIPSNGLNGGLLGNIPVLLGDADINHKVIQVASEDSQYVRANPEMFVPLEESDYFKSASPENQRAILEKSRGRRLYVSREPVSIEVANATYQNFTNGMLNTEGDAIKNGLDQTSSDNPDAPVTFTLNYNPTHGFAGDLMESAVDKFGGTTGIAKQTGEFINDVTTARGRRGSNFASHSQGNLLTKQGVEYRRTHGGFKNKEYFTDPNAPTEDKKNSGIPTFAGYGSPVNTQEMGDTLKKVKFKNLGMFTHPEDFVGEGLGGNKGENGQMSTGERMKSILDIPKLFGPDSPHSTYRCSENSRARCGDRP